MGIIGECPKEPSLTAPTGTKGMKNKRWKPYKPTAYDLHRDPSLAEQKEPFDWKSYREFKAQERNPSAQDDVLYRDFGRARKAAE